MPGHHRAPDLGHHVVGLVLAHLPAREEVGLGVDEQALGHADRGVAIALRQRIHHLQHRGRERRTEAEGLSAAP